MAMKKTLPVFEGKDWRSWSTQAKAQLMMKRFWGTVSKRPTSKQASQAEWQENNDQAIGYILCMVHPAYHFALADASTAAGMWSRLQESYGQADRGSYCRWNVEVVVCIKKRDRETERERERESRAGVDTEDQGRFTTIPPLYGKHVPCVSRIKLKETGS
ncbi:MAG: hypothetical protein BJ554DRAFT_6821 [Olpidium bornovanus]|uniref:Uncharacterized protein n=1 Tax=Olpidium bornovanus TaxID=278681 RepID=A0A8H8DJP8_9FUNG|nr:MAG: hypothetical protein BJ554DRAFT_6821 [Olpidium bornovanus]